MEVTEPEKDKVLDSYKLALLVRKHQERSPNTTNFWQNMLSKYGYLLNYRPAQLLEKWRKISSEVYYRYK